jgi:argininosuccinate lyase
MDPLVEVFSKSIQYDHKLAEYDVLGSIAHVKILKKAGMVSGAEAAKLVSGLKSILASVEKGAFKPDPSVEDIHTDIQNKLAKKVGDLALTLHTARSRNDQVAFSTRMYCKVEIVKMQSDIMNLIVALLALGKKNKGVVIPGFTHMQHAQPVYLNDYLGAYAEMLKRDSVRLNGIFKHMKLTLGAGALAGTPIDASKYKVKAS